MMKKKDKKSVSIDGVVQRQRRRDLSDFKTVRPVERKKSVRQPINETKQNIQADEIPEMSLIDETDILESTRSDIDEDRVAPKGWRAKRRARKLAKKQRREKRHKILRYARRALKYALIGGMVYGAYLALISLGALNGIIDRGDGALALQENIQPSELNGEGDGRVNIMLLGIGGDSHLGGDLADSILVASIDPFAKEMSILSVPRDLYVSIPNNYSTKINAAHALGQEQDRENNYGIELMQLTLEQTLGININYYARVDFDGFKQAIDTVDGVTINLDEPVYDNNFDWEFGRDALRLPAGESTLDGQTALLLSRARGAGSLSYGFERSDFSRTENQRKILLALKDKLLSVDTFANPIKLTELISNAGSHAKTNIQISEMLRINEIINEIPANKIISVGLDDYLVSDTIAGASVLTPSSGDYLEIQLYVREIFVDGFIKQEAPVLDVYNGTFEGGVASQVANELATFGYQIGLVDNAVDQDNANTKVYDLTNGEKPFTGQLLSKRFETTLLDASALPEDYAQTTSDFVIIIGLDDTQEQTSF